MGRRRKNNPLDAFIGSVIIIFVVGVIVVNFVAENIELFIGGGSAILFIILFYKLISHQIGNSDKEREKKRKEKERKDAAEKKAREKKEKAELRAEQAKEKALLKEAKDKEKAEKIARKEASSALSMETFNLFNIVDTKLSESKIEDKDITELDREISIVKESDKEYFNQLKPIKGLDIDTFLLSDDYSSILFSEGIRIVKDFLKGNENYSQIEIGEIEKIIYKSGLYHEYEKANTAIKLIQDTSDWKTLHRILLIHMPQVEFNEISFDLIIERTPMYKKIITEKNFEDLKKVVQATSSQFFVELNKFEREAKENKFYEYVSKAS